MIYLFFLTRKWGTEDCEISSFNYDLCNAVAKQSQLGDGKTKVYCLSLTAESDPDKNSAKENNITIICPSSRFNENDESLDKLPSQYAECVNAVCKPNSSDRVVWIGHDEVTGNLANLFRDYYMSDALKSISIVFHHGEQNTEEKEELQKNILRNADYIWAVGPIMVKSAQDYTGFDDSRIKRIIPGSALFAKCAKKDNIIVPNQFKVLLAVKAGENDDYKRQTKLAIAGFAKAYCEDAKSSGQKVFVRKPRLNIIQNFGEDYTKEDRVFFETLAEKYCNDYEVQYKFIKFGNRDELKKLYQESSLLVLLSKDEDFGISAYEAISVGLPILIYDSLGLNDFLNNKESGANNLSGLFGSVKLNGTLTIKKEPRENDVTILSRAILSRLADYTKIKTNAIDLQAVLSKEGFFSWDESASTFISSLYDIIDNKEGTINQKEKAKVNMWGEEENAEYIRKKLAKDILPSFCDKILGCESGMSHTLVKGVIVRFDLNEETRTTIVIANQEVSDIGSKRDLYHGVVGMMIRKNLDNNECREMKAVYYDFTEGNILTINEGELNEEKNTQYTPGEQDNDLRAIMAFPLYNGSILEGALTLDFYNTEDNELSEKKKREKREYMLLKGTAMMPRLSRIIFEHEKEGML